MGLTNGWWIWAGSPVGATETNDTGLAKRELKNMAKIMEKRDLMIVDRGFRDIRNKIAMLTGWNKPKAQQLPIWQKQENNEISQQRGN
jgi:hypothetical protein